MPLVRIVRRITRFATRLSVPAVFLFVSGTAINARADLKTVPYVDPAKYLTTWYQIARNPLFFEAGCVCSRQILGGLSDGTISVYNSCREKSIDGTPREIRGTATNDDPQSNARFTVDFGLPNKGQYWIIGLDPQYRYAVVSDPSLKSLYILSPTPVITDDLYAAAVKEAGTQVDTTHLEMTTQAGCTYP